MKRTIAVLLLVGMAGCSQISKVLPTCEWREPVKYHHGHDRRYANRADGRIEANVRSPKFDPTDEWETYVRGAAYGPFVDESDAIRQAERVALRRGICAPAMGRE